MKIIDAHAHIANPVAIPHAFVHGWSRTVAAHMPRTLTERERKAMEIRLGSLNSDTHCDELVNQMDQAGINQTVLLAIDFTHHFGNDCSPIEEVHELHIAVTNRHPGRFIPFAGIDPRNGPAGIDRFERAVSVMGFRGVKLYPPCGYTPSDLRLFPYYEICAQYGIPVLTHIGPTTSSMPFCHTAPDDVDSAAYHFPNVTFILGHAGATRYEEAALLAEHRPNVFLDISGFQASLRRGELLNVMNFHRKRGLGRRLLFGTDWPIHRLSGAQRQWVQAIESLRDQGHLEQRDLEDIFFRNFERAYARNW